MDGAVGRPANGQLVSSDGLAATTSAATLATSDLDDVRSYLSTLYCPITVGVPRGVRQFGVRSRDISVGRMTFGTAQFRADMTSMSENDAYNIIVPTAGRLASRQYGAEVLAAPGVAVVFRPGATSHGRYVGRSAQISVRFERATVEDELQAMLGRPLDGPVDLARSLRTDRGPGRSWLQLVQLVFGQLRSGDDGSWHPLVVERLRAALVGQLLFALPHRYRDKLDRPCSPGPPAAVRRAADAIHDDPARPFTVADLAAIAGTSVRSLQLGFRRSFGVTPMTYLKQVRLELAHDILRGEGPERSTVASVAHRCGFLHLGRFAATYRQKYGVQPSDTLRLGT